MKRLVLVAFVFAAGCQGVERSAEPVVEPATGVATSQLELGGAEECGGLANFCGATMPPILSWKSLPQSTPTTVYMFYLGSPSLFYIFGADPAAGQVLWARKFTPTQAPQVLASVAGGVQPSGGIRHPPECETCPPGSDWLAAYILETAVRVPASQQHASDATAACYGTFP